MTFLSGAGEDCTSSASESGEHVDCEPTTAKEKVISSHDAAESEQSSADKSKEQQTLLRK